MAPVWCVRLCRDAQINTCTDVLELGLCDYPLAQRSCPFSCDTCGADDAGAFVVHSVRGRELRVGTGTTPTIRTIRTIRTSRSSRSSRASRASRSRARIEPSNVIVERYIKALN